MPWDWRADSLWGSASWGPVCGVPAASERAHIVTVGEPGAGGHDSADARVQALYDFLTERRVVPSIRRGVLRFSFHVYNDDEDVDRILGLVKEWVDRPSL